MKRRLLQCWLGFALLAVGGCVVSEQPLGTREASKPDRRLVGIWRNEKTPDGLTLRVDYDPQGNGLVSVEAWPGIEMPKPLPSIEFFVTRTDRATYLNAVLDNNLFMTEPHKHYTFVRYSVSEDQKTLRVWKPNLAPLRKAMQEWTLKGTYYEPVREKTEPHSGDQADVPSVQIRDTSDTILRLLESLPPNEAFTDEINFKKVEWASLVIGRSVEPRTKSTEFAKEER